jgi:hypothetical protein
MGSRISGAVEFGEGFQRYLEQKNVPQPEVQILRDAGKIQTAFLGRDSIEQGIENPDPPRGVILLPEMRQYGPGFDMFLDTYGCGIDRYVEELCKEYGIPLIEIRHYKSPQQISQGVQHILELNEPQTF